MNNQEFESLLHNLNNIVETIDYEYDLSTTVSILKESFELITYHYIFPETKVAKKYWKGNKEEVVINFYNYFTDRDLFLIGRKTKDSTLQVVSNGSMKDDKASDVDEYISSGTELTGLILWLIGEVE